MYFTSHRILIIILGTEMNLYSLFVSFVISLSLINQNNLPTTIKKKEGKYNIILLSSLHAIIIMQITDSTTIALIPCRRRYSDHLHSYCDRHSRQCEPIARQSSSNNMSAASRRHVCRCSRSWILRDCVTFYLGGGLARALWNALCV